MTRSLSGPARASRAATTLCGLVAALAASAPTQAAPTYGVVAYSVAADTNGTYAGAGYNAWFIGDPSNLAIDLGQGVTSGTNCSGACTPGFGATPTGTGATQASSQGVLTMTPAGFNPTTADARATADLATGKVGVYASGERRNTGNPFIEGTFGTATARFDDTLSFQVAGANAGTHTQIGIRYVIDGSITECSGGSLQFNLGFGGANAFGSVGENCSNDFVGGSVTAGWVSHSYTVLTAGLIQFDAVYDIVGTQAEIGIMAQLKANAGTFGAVDFLHTGAISLLLPEGVTYSSGSGLFLAGDITSPVPEPASLTLAGLGLALVLLSRRRAPR